MKNVRTGEGKKERVGSGRQIGGRVEWKKRKMIRLEERRPEVRDGVAS